MHLRARCGLRIRRPRNEVSVIEEICKVTSRSQYAEMI